MLKAGTDSGREDCGEDSVWRETERQFRQLLEALPAAAYTCDAEGLITYFNPQAVQVWGRAPRLNDPADRFCGSFALFAPDGAPIAHADCWMARALRERRPFNACEIVIERADGSRITALAHANPVCNADGTLLGAVNVLVDISERTRQEAALRGADRAKNEFLATLAHELRNPLAPIRNVVEILQRRAPLPPDLRWTLDVLDRQVRQMTRLIGDLLDFSRITSNKLKLQRERIALGDVLGAALELSRPAIDAQGHELFVNQPGQRVVLDGDLTRLAQMVSNLLLNAAKYTPPGGRITLGAQAKGPLLSITVRDTGAGIPADMLARIFDLFMQGHEGSSGAHEGLGIGLTLTRRLAELHGGTVSVRSDGPGQGSEFTLRLPIVVGAARGARKPAAALAPAVRPRDILVIDDHRASAATLAALLRLMGHAVQVAHDGAEGLRLADELRPDVVLLDLGMPGMSGLEVAERLRAQPWSRKLLIIAITGWGQLADRERTRAAGFDHHLVKPVDAAELAKLLGQAPASRPGAAGSEHWRAADDPMPHPSAPDPR